jgi:hypothetical protein
MKTVAELMAGVLRKSGVTASPEEKRARQEAYDAAWKAAQEAAARRRDDTFGLHLGRCGVSERLVDDASRPGLLETDALRAARQWLESSEGHLVLAGWTGAGKSVAAAWTFRGALRTAAWGQFDEQEWDENQCLWLPYGVLARLSDFADEDKRLFARACGVRWLVVDDVGLGDAAEPAPHVRAKLELLADARDAPGVRTTWTTNRSCRKGVRGEPSEFARFVGQRIYSRIGRSVVVVDCGTQDLRRQR